MHAELIRTTTADGLRLDGALFAPSTATSSSVSQPPIALDAILCLHGVTSNFYSAGLTEKITPALLELGTAVAWVNTRGHDVAYNAYVGDLPRRQGSAFEIVDECRLDLAAWIELLVSRGMRRIGLWGHSLGAIKAVYMLAHEPHDAVRALVASSPPRLSYAAYMAAGTEGFAESMRHAQRLLAEGRGQEFVEITRPYPQLIAAAAYVDKYGPAERYSLLPMVSRLPCPALFTYGALELSAVPFAGLPELLPVERRADQTLDVVVVPGANHQYTGVQQNLAREIAAWLRKHAA